MIRMDPNLNQALTPYSAFNAHQDKEAVWEQVRTEKFANRPTRLKSFFAFDELSAANKLKNTWFANEDRQLIEVRVLAVSNVFKADSRWLNAHSPDWHSNARRYWNGDMSKDPATEIIIDGGIYCPEWETFPIGFGF